MITNDTAPGAGAAGASGPPSRRRWLPRLVTARRLHALEEAEETAERWFRLWKDADAQHAAADRRAQDVEERADELAEEQGRQLAVLRRELDDLRVQVALAAAGDTERAELVRAVSALQGALADPWTGEQSRVSLAVGLLARLVQEWRAGGAGCVSLLSVAERLGLDEPAPAGAPRQVRP